MSSPSVGSSCCHASRTAPEDRRRGCGSFPGCRERGDDVRGAESDCRRRLLDTQADKPLGAFAHPHQPERGECLSLEPVLDGVVGEDRAGADAEVLRLEPTPGDAAGQAIPVVAQALVREMRRPTGCRCRSPSPPVPRSLAVHRRSTDTGTGAQLAPLPTVGFATGIGTNTQLPRAGSLAGALAAASIAGGRPPSPRRRTRLRWRRSRAARRRR